MSGISFQGVGSGLPVQQIIDAIVKVRQVPIDKANKEVKNFDTKISEYGKLSNLLESFRNSLNPFRLTNTAFEEQFAVKNSNEDLITVTKKAGYNHKETSANFKLLDITNPSAQKNWTWASQKVIADYHYSGTMTMAGSTVDFTDKTGGYTLDEMIEKINNTTGLKDTVVAKKVLVNEHTDPTKNTYSLRLESKIGGQAGELNDPIFGINTITNNNSTGGTTGAGGTAGTGGGTGTNTNVVNITGGAHITVDSNALNQHKPSFIVDLTGHTNDTDLTIFFDRDNDGNITDPGGWNNNDEKVHFTKLASDGIEAFKLKQYYTNGSTSNLNTVSIEKAGNNKLRITIEGLNDNQLKTYNPNDNRKPTIAIGSKLAINRDGYDGSVWYNNTVINTSSEKNMYSGNATDTQPVAANVIQPNIYDKWKSSAVANGATITEDTSIKINSQNFDLKDKTLNDVATEINNSSLSANLTASVVQNGGNQRLILTSKEAGSGGYLGVQVVNNNTGTGNNPPPPPPSNPVNDLVKNAQASITSNLDEKDLQIRFSVNGQVYTRYSYDLDTSKIAGLEGVDVKVNAKALNATNKSAEIVITKDADETKKHTKKAMQTFVDSYNAIVEFVNSQTQIEIKGGSKYTGALHGDSVVKSILSSLEAELSNATGGDLKHSLVMMGISHVDPMGVTTDAKGNKMGGKYTFGTLNPHVGKLQIDDKLFSKALTSGTLKKTLSGYKDANGTEHKGYGDRFQKLTDWMISGMGSTGNFTGLITMRKKSLENEQKQMQEKAYNLTRSLQEYQERLVRQFSAADTIAAKMNQINATLAKQFGNAGLISSAMGK